MISHLLDLLDSLDARQADTCTIMDKLMGEPGPSLFLEDEIEMVERLIVVNLGGDSNDYNAIEDTHVFKDYRNKEVSRSELVVLLKKIIENNNQNMVQVFYDPPFSSSKK